MSKRYKINYQIRACRRELPRDDFYKVYEGRPADDGRIDYCAIADFDTEEQAEAFVAEKERKDAVLLILDYLGVTIGPADKVPSCEFKLVKVVKND